MKKTFLLSVLLVCMLTVSASAAYIPEEVITENRDGRQLIIKTYTLSPTDDPSALVEDPFELEGFRYQHLDTVKEDIPFSETKQHSETVTVTTDSDSLESILAQLPPTMEYDKDGYSGVLTLDHTGLETSAAGYTTKYYTISDTREFTGLDRNDPSYVPTTSVKNGTTLTLSNITWAVTGTGLAGDTLVPTSYTATATYTATGSRRVATGYITTAKYTGEITAQGVNLVCYTVTYLGTPIASETALEADFWPGFVWLAVFGALLLLAVFALSAYFLWLRPNASIYAMNAKGVAYKRLGRQRITSRQPRLDLTRLKEYPSGEASVELEGKIAHKLAGRIIMIQLYGETRTHLVEPFDGDENYWFAISEDKKEDTEV